MYLEFTIEGEKEVSAVLGFAADNIGDFRRPLYATGQLIMSDVETNYDRRGRLFSGGGWVPRKYERPWPLLENTRKLRRGFRKVQTRDAIKVENNVDYFKYHQSNKPRKIIPRRVMLTIVPQTRTKIFKEFQKAAVEALQARTV